MKPLRKAQARLERRLKDYATTMQRLGSSSKADGFHKPGSSKKRSPKGGK